MAAELKIGIGADNSGLKKGLQDAEKQIAAFINKLGAITVPKIVVPPIVMPKVPKVEVPPIVVPDVPPIVIPPIAPIPPIDVPDVPPIVIPPIDDEPIKDLKEKLKDLGETMSSIGQKMSIAITLPIVALGTAAVKTYGDLQSLEMGLKAVMGSAAEASGEFEKLREVAKLPGLGLKEAVRGSVSLQAAGFSADNARKSLLAFGNALATVGKGANEMNYVILALTQLQNKSSGFGQDLRQLTEQLPQLRGALISAFGTMDTEAIGKMGVTGAQVVEKLTAEFAKLPKVTGGIKNAFENLSDNLFINMSRIGKIIDDTFDISGIIDKLTGYLDTAISYFENLNPAVQQAILVVSGLAAAAGPLLVVVGGIMQAIPTVVAGLGAFKIALVALTGPIGLVVAGIAGIIAIVVSQWDKIKPYIQGTIKWFQDLYKESAIVRMGVQSIGFAFNALYQVVKGALNAIWGYIKSFGKAVLETFAGIGDVIMGAFTLSPEKIASGFQRINRAFVTGLSEVISTTQRAGQNIFKGIFGLDKADIGGKEELTKKVEKTVTDAVTGGVTAANAKKNNVKVELPDIEPLTQNTAGFMNNLGETFDTLEEMDNRSSEIFERMGQGVQSFVTKFSDETLRLQELTMRFNESFTALWQGAMADTISNAFSAMGEAMTNGGNVFESFGSAVLNGISGFLGQLGELMIQYGLAASVFGKLEAALLSSPDPFTKIAAGLAMVAAGATLSMLGGAIKGAISGGSRGSGGSTSSAGGYSSGYSTRYSSGGTSGAGGEYTFRISGYDLIATIDRNRNRLDRLT